jgi:hypothetical protein
MPPDTHLLVMTLTAAAPHGSQLATGLSDSSKLQMPRNVGAGSGVAAPQPPWPGDDLGVVQVGVEIRWVSRGHRPCFRHFRLQAHAVVTRGRSVTPIGGVQERLPAHRYVVQHRGLTLVRAHPPQSPHLHHNTASSSRSGSACRSSTHTLIAGSPSAAGPTGLFHLPCTHQPAASGVAQLCGWWDVAARGACGC